VGEDPQVAEYPLLCVFPDGAGIQQDEVRLPGLRSQGEPHLPQHPLQALAVGLVLLAPEGVHAGQGMGLPGGKHGPDFLLKVPLAGQSLRRDQYIGAFQKLFLQMQIL
jgi:hypothetical protein